MQSTIREALEGIRRILSIVARFTPTDLDDKVVQLIDVLLQSDELIGWLEDLFGLPGAQAHSQSDAMAKLQLAAAQAGIDWLELIQTLLPYLLQLLQFFLDKNGDDPQNAYDPATTGRC